MTTLNIQIRGADQLIAALEGAKDKIDRKVIESVVASAFRIQGRARRSVAVDTGRTRSALFVRFLDGGRAADVGSDLASASAIERGRRPGSFPPIGPIRAWSRRVLGNEGAAFAVARKIAFRGIKPRPFLIPAFEAEKPRLLKRLKQVLAEGVKR